MAKHEEEIIDLTELIEPGHVPGKRGVAAYAAAQNSAAPPEDDFSAILEQTAGVGEAGDELAMPDMDSLMDSLDMPAQPKHDSPPKEASPEELDSVLDELLGPDTKPSPEIKQPAAPVADSGDPGIDLDNDLDDILASFDDAPKPAKTAPASTPELDADLDDILADMEPPKPAAPEPHEPEPAQEEYMFHPGVKAAAEAALADTAEQGQPQSGATESDGLDDLLDAPEASDSEAVLDDLGVETDELDDLFLQDSPKKDAGAAGQKENLAHSEQIGQSGTEEDLPTAADLEAMFADEPQADLEAEPVKDEPEIQQSLPASSAPGYVEASQPLAAQGWSQEMVAGLCRNIAAAQGNQETLQKFSRELGEQSAHVEDMGDQLAQLGKRLLACESRLSASRARIAGLEKGLEATGALDDLLREGSSLHSGFMGLISTAVTNALKGFTPQSGQSEEAMAAIANLEQAMSSTDKRLDMLESKLDALAEVNALNKDFAKLSEAMDNTAARLENLEKKFNSLAQEFRAGMEKAAAATVAKVLQEEILRMAQE